jgi:hypothetical protein
MTMVAVTHGTYLGHYRRCLDVCQYFKGPRGSLPALLPLPFLTSLLQSAACDTIDHEVLEVEKHDEAVPGHNSAGATRPTTKPGLTSHEGVSSPGRSHQVYLHLHPKAICVDHAGHVQSPSSHQDQQRNYTAGRSSRTA